MVCFIVNEDQSVLFLQIGVDDSLDKYQLVGITKAHFPGRYAYDKLLLLMDASLCLCFLPYAFPRDGQEIPYDIGINKVTGFLVQKPFSRSSSTHRLYL